MADDDDERVRIRSLTMTSYPRPQDSKLLRLRLNLKPGDAVDDEILRLIEKAIDAIADDTPGSRMTPGEWLNRWGKYALLIMLKADTPHSGNWLSFVDGVYSEIPEDDPLHTLGASLHQNGDPYNMDEKIGQLSNEVDEAVVKYADAMAKLKRRRSSFQRRVAEADFLLSNLAPSTDSDEPGGENSGLKLDLKRRALEARKKRSQLIIDQLTDLISKYELWYASGDDLPPADKP